MRIAILSDTHGNQASVAEALKLLTPMKISCILHCGDIDDPQTLLMIAEVGLPAHFVLGNCDADAAALAQAASTAGTILHGRFADLDLGGKRVALVHGHEKRRLDEAIQGRRYDYLFYGHTHVAEHHLIGRTHIVNPGALHRARPRSFAVLDMKTGDLEFVRLQERRAES